MNKIVITALLLGFCSINMSAQSGTNSPYSQYALGELADQGLGINRGMGGLSQGIRSSNNVNVLNPASYSIVDSMTMLFDVGLSGQITNFKEGNRKVNANNADFEYAVGSFRMLKNLGCTFGILPYSNIGYNYSSKRPVENTSETLTSTFSGEGGIHVAFLGLGYRLFKPLSVGANFGYLWGDYTRTLSMASSDAYVNTMTKTYSANIRSYKLDFGMQWEQSLGGDNILTLGATYSFGHKLGADPQMVFSKTDPQTSVSSSDTVTVKDALAIPHTFSVGATYKKGTRLLIGADYQFMKWSNIDYPISTSDDDYITKSGLLMDRHKVTIGGQWTPDLMSRNLLKRISYRVGASYSTPYFKVNGVDGPKEYSVSAGFGIPISNSWSNRSILNISGQWVRSSAKDLITENTFRINIGITFNERWFMSWKVE